MEFESQYLTYDEYLELGGTILKESPFNLLEFKARKQIDKYTFGRLINLDNQIQEVKICMYELINTLENFTNATSSETMKKGIASESIDGYSVSYASNISSMAQINQSQDAVIQDLIYTYLANCKLEDGTPYLYRGKDASK